MLLRKALTVVIPNKNEGLQLFYCLNSINNQKNISALNVIIADNSDKGKEPTIDSSDFQNLNIKVIKGGLPAYGRFVGSIEVETPYVLFLDADMILLHPYLLSDIFDKYEGKFDLLTIPFRTDKKWDWCYRFFDWTQFLIHKIAGHPFAIGGFQLFKTSAYWAIGGYNPFQEFAEDYSISLKIKPKRFIVFNHKFGVWTSPRRFQNKGIWYMVKLMALTYLNRNNPNWFKKSHGYWS